MTETTSNETITRIAVFEYRGSGEKKIEGIRQFGHSIILHPIINIEEALPEFIDQPEEFLDDDFQADLVLCFIRHPDLIDHLASLCQKKNIPMIASGCKTQEEAITPFTCCGLGKLKGLGHYGEQFGLPEFEVRLENEQIQEVIVKRGASCGATWDAIGKIIGLSPEEAYPTLAREVQYLCVADPSSFDPISGKSSLHYAGHVHIAALKKALVE